jgi:flagellar protein FliO/FliZ
MWGSESDERDERDERDGRKRVGLLMNPNALSVYDRKAGLKYRGAVRRRLASITSITFITFITSAAYAAEPFAAPRAADPVTTTAAGGLVQVTLSLLLVLAAVFAAAWAVRRLRGIGRFGAGAIEIIAEVALGQKERAVLVQVGKQQLLLGVAAGQVNTLHVLAENVDVRPRMKQQDVSVGDLGPGQTSGLQPPAHLQFKAILKRSLGL